MYAERPTEVINGQAGHFDLDWPRKQAWLLLWLGMQDIPIPDFGQVAETEMEIEPPLSGSNNFDFDVFFRQP